MFRTVAVENDSVAWLLTRQKYKELEKNHRDVAAELLKVGLKLTKERMDAITSYVLLHARANPFLTHGTNKCVDTSL